MRLVIQDGEQYNTALNQACDTSPRIQLLITEWPRQYNICKYCGLYLVSIQSCQYTIIETFG